MKTEVLVLPTGNTYYAFPVSKSLADWTTYRVLFTESASPNQGLYTASLDEANGTKWALFSGASQPAGFYSAASTFTLSASAESTGARSRTFYVREAIRNVALEGAKIRLTKGAESYVLTTNASGEAYASLDDGTYSVAISLFGYTFTPTTLVVSASATTMYEMNLVLVSPSDIDRTTGYWTVYDLSGVAQSGAQVELRTANTPSGSTGLVLEDSVRTSTSASNGLVEFSNLFPGVSYIVNRAGSTRQYTITVPASAGDSVALGSIVG